MALLWADGFDHYGTSTTSRTNMLLGVYAQVQNTMGASTTNPRNGICSLTNAFADAANSLRRVFGGTKGTGGNYVGVGGAFYLTQLPSVNDAIMLMSFNDAANLPNIALFCQSDGTLTVKAHSAYSAFSSWLAANSPTVLGSSSTPAFFAGSWNHIEMKATFHNTTGRVYVYANGVNVIDTGAGGVDTVSTNFSGVSNAVEASQVEFMRCNSSSVLPWYMDDIFAWDHTGSYNNDVIGDKDVLPYYYDGDGATVQWVRNTGSNDYEMVDETVQDGDTTYLQASNASDVQEFTLGGIPSTVSDIVAVVLVNLMRKTQAGACNVRADIVETGGSASTGTDNEMTEEYQYWHDVVERNPAGSAQWTYTTLNDSKLRLTRTT